jgi:hypothetical protein
VNRQGTSVFLEQTKGQLVGQRQSEYATDNRKEGAKSLYYQDTLQKFHEWISTPNHQVGYIYIPRHNPFASDKLKEGEKKTLKAMGWFLHGPWYVQG